MKPHHTSSKRLLRCLLFALKLAAPLWLAASYQQASARGAATAKQPQGELDVQGAEWPGQLFSFLGPPPGQGMDRNDPRQLLLARMGARKAIILNGDDFGHNTRVNQGIIEAYQRGLLSSISLQAPEWDAEDALGYVKRSPRLDWGVHLTLTSDRGQPLRPLSPLWAVNSLVDGQGRIPKAHKPLPQRSRCVMALLFDVFGNLFIG
jgi:hypothetical protein